MATKKTPTKTAPKSIAKGGVIAKKKPKASAGSTAKAPSSVKQGSFSAKSVVVKSTQAAPAPQLSGGKMVRVDVELTAKQKTDLEKLTGKKIKALRLTVQDLADLANVILN
jgi:hypothetical protein